MRTRNTLSLAALGMFYTLKVVGADATAIATNTRPTVISNTCSERFAAGVILGEPTGASLKYWLNETTAIDGAIGASFNDDSDNDASLFMDSDFLWHNFDLIPVSKGRLPVYFGVGGLLRFRNDEDNQFGIRVPVGLSYLLDDTPVEIFAEIGPALDLTPDVRGEITGGIGVRFRF